MFFIPVSWPNFEMACIAPNGRTAIAISESKRVQVLGRAGARDRWRVVREWAPERLSHTDIVLFLGSHPEPDSAEAVVELLRPIDPDAGGSPR